MWFTPPGPYRRTTCRWRDLNFGSHTYFFDHTRTWTASPYEGSAQCQGHLRDSINIPTRHTLIHSNKANMKWWLWRPNDIRGPCGLVLLVRKNPGKRTHPGNLSRPGIEPGPAAWQARMLPLVPQRWTMGIIFHVYTVSEVALTLSWSLHVLVWSKKYVCDQKFSSLHRQVVAL